MRIIVDSCIILAFDQKKKKKTTNERKIIIRFCIDKNKYLRMCMCVCVCEARRIENKNQIG
jgi:hypothetical protein